MFCSLNFIQIYGCRTKCIRSYQHMAWEIRGRVIKGERLSVGHMIKNLWRTSSSLFFLSEGTVRRRAHICVRRGSVHTFVRITSITVVAGARILPASLDKVVDIPYVTTKNEIGWYIVRGYTWPNERAGNLRLIPMDTFDAIRHARTAIRQYRFVPLRLPGKACHLNPLLPNVAWRIPPSSCTHQLHNLMNKIRTKHILFG
jgi:hypothetical protein